MRKCVSFTINILKHLNSCLIIYFFLVLFCLLGTAQAQQTSRIMEKNDWATFVAENPKECWAVSRAAKSNNTRNGKNVSINRAEILLFTSFRPSEGIKGQITFSPGYRLSQTKKFLSVLVLKPFICHIYRTNGHGLQTVPKIKRFLQRSKGGVQLR